MTDCRTVSTMSWVIALLWRSVSGWRSFGWSIFSGFCIWWWGAFIVWIVEKIAVSCCFDGAWNWCRRIWLAREGWRGWLRRFTFVGCVRRWWWAWVCHFVIIPHFRIDCCFFLCGWPQNYGDSLLSTATAWSHMTTNLHLKHFSVRCCSTLTSESLPYW